MSLMFQINKNNENFNISTRKNSSVRNKAENGFLSFEIEKQKQSHQQSFASKYVCANVVLKCNERRIFEKICLHSRWKPSNGHCRDT